MLKKSSFNLGGRQTMSRYVHNIVNTATDPVVSIMITAGTITGELSSVRYVVTRKL